MKEKTDYGMTKDKKIRLVQQFREEIESLQLGSSSSDTRKTIAQMRPIVSKIMTQYKTIKRVTVTPPPLIGGPAVTINPLDHLFDVPYGTTYDVRAYLLDMLDATIGLLQNDEHIEDHDISNFPWYIMHPEIIRVARKRFDAELYADAVEAAFKEINLQVKTKCKGRHQNKDGKGLMTIAFSGTNPVLKFKESSVFSNFDIQEGYMHMFAGAMQGIRNPKAHENDIIDKADALRKLAFASMLMYKLDTVVD